MSKKSHFRVTDLVCKAEPDSRCSLGLPRINTIFKPDINPENIVLHLRLLERYVKLRQNVREWAESENLPPARVWSCTINLASQRMFQWFCASRDWAVDKKLPPLDVLLVWHSFLSKPAKWKQFVRETGVEVECFPWDKLKHALVLSTPEQFRLPSRSVQVAARVFEHVDILDILKANQAEFTRPRRHLEEDWASPVKCFPVPTMHTRVPCVHIFTMDFHESVMDCLQFANRILEYSWDAMYPHISVTKQHFRPSVDRYARYMDLQAAHKKSKSKYKRRSSFQALTATPDVELVWRTHVLEHRAYESFRHDLRLDHPPRHFNYSWDHSIEDLELTNDLYSKRFRETYTLCLCWYCMASRNSVQDRGFCPVLVHVVQQLEKRPTQVSSRPFNIQLVGKQCCYCGTHPWRACQPRGRETDSDIVERSLTRRVLDRCNDCSLTKALLVGIHGFALGLNIILMSP